MTVRERVDCDKFWAEVRATIAEIEKPKPLELAPLARPKN
jgi:hypothetical protein